MSKTADIEITAREACGIRCPFTGAELHIVGHIDGGHIVYNAPDAFSLAEPQESIERLYARASMRNGVEGGITRDESLTDPYTGNRLTLKQLPDGRYIFRGGFDPRRAMMSLAEFVKIASRGERVFGEAPQATSVEHVEEDVPTVADESDAPHTVVEEISEKAAHDVTKALGLDHKKTTVAMPGKAKGKK